MYNILIIDDAMEDPNREEIYDFIFKKRFEYTKTINDLTKIKKYLNLSNFDCVVLDNNLDVGESKNKIIEIISNYDLPIIIVSNTRSFNSSDWNMLNIIDCISLKPFFHLKNLLSIHNSKFECVIEETVQLSLSEIEMRINKAIYKARGYDNNIDDERLTICQISDLQFGDPQTNSIDLDNFFSKLESFVNGRSIKPDLVVITGDITFSGYKKQFSQAKDAISKFMEKVYGSEKENRLLLVPGNHDFNYNCFIVDENKDNFKLSDNSSYNFDKLNSTTSKSIDIEKIKELKITPNDFDKFEANDIFLHDFSMFAYELTKDESYFKSDLFIRKKSLINKGFQIIGINNAYKFFRVEKDKIRYDFDYNKIEENINSSKQKSIIIGHTTPEALGFHQICMNKLYRCNKNYEQECAQDGCQKWGNTERIMTELNGLIYLHGHGHYSDYKLSDDKTKLFISAGSPSGINEVEKTLNIIEIEDTSNIINLNIMVNKCTSLGIKYYCNYKLDYNKDIGEWIDLNENKQSSI